MSTAIQNFKGPGIVHIRKRNSQLTSYLEMTETRTHSVNLNSMMGVSNLPAKKNGGKIILGTIQLNKKE